jgi:hypothetical protein
MEMKLQKNVKIAVMNVIHVLISFHTPAQVVRKDTFYLFKVVPLLVQPDILKTVQVEIVMNVIKHAQNVKGHYKISVYNVNNFYQNFIIFNTKFFL